MAARTDDHGRLMGTTHEVVLGPGSLDSKLWATTPGTVLGPTCTLAPHHTPTITRPQLPTPHPTVRAVVLLRLPPSDHLPHTTLIPTSTTYSYLDCIAAHYHLPPTRTPATFHPCCLCLTLPSAFHEGWRTMATCLCFATTNTTYYYSTSQTLPACLLNNIVIPIKYQTCLWTLLVTTWPLIRRACGRRTTCPHSP